MESTAFVELITYLDDMYTCATSGREQLKEFILLSFLQIIPFLVDFLKSYRTLCDRYDENEKDISKIYPMVLF